MKKLGLSCSLLIVSSFCCFGQDQRVADSLLNELKKTLPDTLRVQTNLRLANLYIQELMPDESFPYIESAFRLSEKIRYKVGVARCYLHFGLAEHDKGNYALSYEYGMRALEVAEKEKLWQQVSASYVHLGRVMISMENLESAIKYFEKSNQIVEKHTKNEATLQANYVNLAIVSRKQKRYSDAIAYYMKAMDLAVKLNRIASKYTIINNIGNVYLETKEYDKALTNYKQVLEYAQSNKITNLSVIAKLNIAECYTELKDFDKAAPLLYEIKYICSKYSFPELYKENLEYLYKFHNYQSNSDSALFYYMLFNNEKERLLSIESKERLRRMEKELENRSQNNVIQGLELKNRLNDLLIANQQERNKSLELDSMLQSKQLLQLLEERKLKEIEEQKRKIEEEKLLQENELLKKDRQLQRYFYVIGVIGFILAGLTAAFALLVFKTSRRRKSDLALLTQQNIEITKIGEEILEQKKQIEAKNEELKDQSLLIGQSLQAANTIQQAMLPYDSRMREVFDDFFAIYLPRDVVSGDFYWMAKVDSKTILAVGDCTGHGVPGAFMAMIGYAILDKIILLQENFDPASILKDLHNEVRFAFRNQGSGEATGMDISVVLVEEFEPQLYRVVFSGAKSDFYYATLSQSNVLRIRGNNATIGSFRGLKHTFKNHILYLEKGSCFYLCSDGYADQINPEKVRFGKMRFMKKLSEIKNLPMEEQKQNLSQTLAEFKGQVAQRDDILILGVKL